MAENVVVVTGAEPREVLDVLGGLHDAGSLELRAAAIVHRDADGHLELDHEAGDALGFAERHPRLGALVTLLLGPIDTLLFGNQLVSLYGATEQSPEELAIGHLARTVPAGGTAVIADVDEPDHGVLDAKLPGATVARRPYADVEREVEAAREGAPENG
ncbi:hypothetical protein LWC33_27395 [Pseudonocardia sp. RS11V-5]|uniref:hypothetical protein n=1 Tax=Pseudonocardia terrae TaxID=2905831 RepID=UPI001E640637|nr:hypothetical protein [Pseudonocardia terrae]MCE3555164.1 hypothetical protein [Pseudonocardia terrae]